MGVGAIFVLLGLLWALQLFLAYQQAQRFMRQARVLRRQGRVSIGASRRQFRDAPTWSLRWDPTTASPRPRRCGG